MSFTRARALRSVQSALSKGAPRVSAPRAQLVAKRFASGGHGGHAPPGSDLPWLISALVVTPVSCWYLWPEAKTDSHHGHGHDDHAAHDDAHEKEDAEEKDEADAKDEPAEEVAEKDEEPASETAEEKTEDKAEDDSEGKSESAEDEESSDDDSEESEEKNSDPTKRGTTGKNKIRADSEGQSVTRKVEPGNKGGNKIRLDSGLGKNLGEGINSDEAYNNSPGVEKSAFARKQNGVSNTDTRHSVKIDEPGSGLSTKGNGSPETAKQKGTVDPNAPVK